MFLRYLKYSGNISFPVKLWRGICCMISFEVHSIYESNKSDLKHFLFPEQLILNNSEDS